MIKRTTILVIRELLVLSFSFALVFAALKSFASDDTPEPILRIETWGHSSFITSLAWHPNGRELWSAGWDKIVRVWRRTDQGTFVGIPEESVRVPIGPGKQGQIDSIAFSSDGRWLAIGGFSHLSQRAASFGVHGILTPTSSIERLEMGVIYLLDRTDNSIRRLEGHRGFVRRLEFARTADGSDLLISAGDDMDVNQKEVGSIRTWDVATARQVDGILLPEAPKNRPSLAIFGRSSPKAGVQVLAAWGNQKFYHWESLKPPSFRPYTDGKFNNMIVADPSAKWVATGSSNNETNEGNLTFWNINALGLAERDLNRIVKFPSEGNEIFAPMGLTLMSSRPNGDFDHIAVALCVIKLDTGGKAIPDRFQLRVLKVPTKGATSVEIVRKELWKVDSTGVQVPDLAATSKGEHLAIAGNPNHDILVISISDLLKRNTKAQTLSGRASATEQVAFVERQGELGLRIVEKTFETAALQAKYVFDFQNSRVDTDMLPWKEYTANTKGWSVGHNELQLKVVHQDRVVRTISAPKRHKISHAILTTPIDETLMPLLIVAAHEDGQPWLGLFDVKDGTLKRVFNAHTGMIGSLALSGDSRLLATASSDQTIAIWDISDVETILQPRSTLNGVALVEKNQVMVVDQVQESANANIPLKAGDQLLSYFDPANPSELRKWPSTPGMKDPLWEQKSATQVKVRRQRGTERSDVLITLDQAADERKPLFQLMITRLNNQGQRQWIGWSPLGPFDASDHEIRQRLGWHFNVNKPNTPVAFAPIDQYPNLNQPGMLAKAVNNRGRLPEVVPLSFLEPQMNLKVLEPETERWNKSGTAVVRTPPQSITLKITNTEFTGEMIKEVRLKVDGDLKGLFSPNGKGHWQFGSLQLAAWNRGKHRIQAELETRTVPARTFAIEEPLDYVPNAPTIEPLQRPAAMTKESNIAVLAKVRPGQKDVPLDVRLFRLNDKQSRDVVKAWETNQKANNEIRIELPLELREGPNQFLLEAQNRGSTVDTKSLEAASWKFDVTRIPRDMSPPTIDVTGLQYVSDANPDPIKLELREPLVVESERVTLLGSIHAEEKLSAATLAGKELPGFVPNTSVDFTLQVPLQLMPGLNTIRLASKTQVSQETTYDVSVLFRQPLPEVEIVQPSLEQLIETLLDQSTVRLSARFQPNSKRRPVSVVATINGLRIEQPIVADLSSGVIQGKIPLKLGTNTLQLQLSNDTGAEKQTEPITLYYQPTPVVDGRQVPGEIEGTAFDVELAGISASPIERILMDSRELPKSQWQTQMSGTRFKLNVTALPLQSDRRQFGLAVFAFGIAKPAFVTLDMPKRKQPTLPPTLAFLSPNDSTSVTSELVAIEYLVRSKTDLKRVELLHESQPIVQPPFEPTKDGTDSIVRKQVEVRLRTGTNSIQLVAENKDGLRSQTLTLNYVPSPVEIVLDSLTPFDNPEASQSLTQRSDGTWGMDRPVETSRNLLKGRVRWNYRDDVAISDANAQVWISVNGFKQSIRLEASNANSRERQFTSQVQLFRTQANIIEVMATDLRRLASAKKIVRVDCQSPQLPRQRLHLVIIGIGVQSADEAGLRSDAVASLAGTDLRMEKKEFSFKSSAFAECNGYGPFIGASVSREKIGSILDLVRLRIQELQTSELANDVMMVYYRGGEQVDLGGQFYLTTRVTQTKGDADVLRTPLQLQHFAVSSVELADFVNHCPGSHLVLLDVSRSAYAQSLANNCFVPGAATFRYAWLKGVDVPADARLISAWKVAPEISRLNQIEGQLSVRYARLVERYKDSVSYENQVPEVLRELVMGASQ